MADQLTCRLSYTAKKFWVNNGCTRSAGGTVRREYKMKWVKGGHFVVSSLHTTVFTWYTTQRSGVVSSTLDVGSARTRKGAEMFSGTTRSRLPFHIVSVTYFSKLFMTWGVKNNTAHFSGILTHILFSYMTNSLQTGRRIERNLMKRVKEIEYDVMSLGLLYDVRITGWLSDWPTLGWYLEAAVVVWFCVFSWTQSRPDTHWSFIGLSVVWRRPRD